MRSTWLRVDRLRRRLQQGHGDSVRLVETHLSWVLLTPTDAYKLKKPIRLPFVDFRSLASRQFYCAEEVRLNRRLAPELYLGVAEVRGTDGDPHFGGEGAVLDAAVHMRRFDDGALWSERAAAGLVQPGDVDRLAQRLAEFHRDAEVAPAASEFASAAMQEATSRLLVEQLDSELAAGGELVVEGSFPTSVGGVASRAASAAGWPALREALLTRSAALAPQFESRRRAGRVRECHGDLHLANVIQRDGEPTAFDAVEFDPALRWIDVLEDIAFTAMDLMAHGAEGLAYRFIDAYLTASGEHDGLPVLRFYLARRALVRAMVMAISPRRDRGGSACGAVESDAYLALARTLLSGEDPRLAITHGLPGSGKTFVSQALLEAAGAIRVRSDVERKRLFRAGPDAPASTPGGDIYTTAHTTATYARLRAIADIALAAGWPVIVDAAFLRRAERTSFTDLARDRGVPFAIVDCRAELPALRERIAQRQALGIDASEADVAVLERMRSWAEPFDVDEARSALVVVAGEPLVARALADRWRLAPRPIVTQGRLVGHPNCPGD